MREGIPGLPGKNADTVLLAYGGGSIKRNGIYDEVLGILKEEEKPS